MQKKERMTCLQRPVSRCPDLGVPTSVLYHLSSRFLAGLLAVFMILAVTSPWAFAVDRSGADDRLTDDDLLLCILRLDNSVLSRAFMTFMDGDELFLPLGELARLLELGIDVDPDARRAEGYVARPDKPFLLDLTSGTITVSGTGKRYDPEGIVVMPDDIYVTSSLLNSWLSMRIDADRFNAAVIIEPYEPLPLQKRLAREQRGSNTWGYGEEFDPGYPLVSNPYTVAGGPAIDLTLFSSVSGFPGRGVSPGTTSYYTAISGDLLWMNAYVDLSGNLDGSVLPDNGRLLLERADYNGSLLGPVGARYLAFGDIQSARLPLVGNSYGPGFMISSYPLEQARLFDQVTLNGYLPPGWDVELYRNNGLLDYRPASSSESYSFADLPLVYGINELELVFYGPQGQERKERYTYHIGQNMLEPGTWAYQFTVSDPSRRTLFDPKDSNITTDGGPLLTWKNDIGLATWLTVSGFFSSGPVDDERTMYGGFGMNGFFEMMQVDLSLARDLLASEWAWRSALNSRFGRWNISLGWEAFSDDWSSLSGNTSWKRNWLARIDRGRFSMQYRRTDDVSGSNREIFRFRSYFRTFGVTHTNSLIFEQEMTGESRTRTVSGQLYANLLQRNALLRLESTYDLHPDPVLSTIALTGDIPLRPRVSLNGSMQYSVENGLFNTRFGLLHRAGMVSLGLNGQYTSNGAWNAGITLSMNVTREPRRNRWVTDTERHTRQGVISAFVYLDANRNKVFDEGEERLEGVGFFLNRGDWPETTDKTGILVLNNLTANIPVNIGVSKTTLPDILWVPANEGVKVVPRSGYAAPIDFPVWVTGEVSGTVYQKQAGKTRTVQGITVEAVNGEGEVVATALSQYDGFYILDSLPTGNLVIRTDANQAGDLGVNADETTVTIPGSGGYVDYIDVVLQADDD